MATKENAAPMNRADVAGAIAAKHGMPQSQADAVTREYEAAIVRALVSGQEVRLNGFGSFKLVHKEARISRNPKTGEPIAVAAKTVPKFQPSKTMKDAISPKVVAKAPAKAPAKAAAKAPAKAAAKAPAKAAAAKSTKKSK